jgi:hypothetical protein
VPAHVRVADDRREAAGLLDAYLARAGEQALLGPAARQSSADEAPIYHI